MSSWKLPDLRSSWKAVTDKADEEENINKVTLPVGLIIGVIGILVASWLIWCVLGGCDSASAKYQKATEGIFNSAPPQRSTLSTPGKRPMFGFKESDAPKAKQAKRASFAYNAPEKVRVEASKPATTSVINSNAAKASRNMEGSILKVAPRLQLDSTENQTLLALNKVKKEVNDVVKALDAADDLVSKSGKFAGPKGFETPFEAKRRLGQAGGGNKDLTGLPLVVIIIMMLVVRAKLTDRR